MKSGKWATPIQGHAGFPDLVLVGGRVLYRELKSMRGRTSDAQSAWLASLRAAGADACVWRPSDWDEIVVELGRIKRA